MKNAILILLLPVLLPFATTEARAQSLPAGAPFRLDADAARFARADSVTHVEVFYGVSEASLTYAPVPDGYRGTLLMSIVIRDSARVVASREWSLPRAFADTAELRAPRNILSFESLALPDGRYGVTLLARDSLDPSRADSVVLAIPVSAASRAAESFSDVELCSRVTPGADRSSPFYRNTLEVIPNPARLYGEGLPVVHFYAEVYNLDRSAGPPLLFSASILDAGGREVAVQTKPKPRTSASSVEYGSMNIASLPGGSYLLRLTLSDTSASGGGAPVASASKKFFVYNPGTAGAPAAPPAAVDRLFSFATEREADDEIRKVRYLASEPERRQMDQLADLTAKRNFLKAFWSGREGGTAEGSSVRRDEYLDRIAAADREYGEQGREGWLTDRGRVSILYGAPDNVERHPSMPESHPYEIWEYHALQGGVLFIFVDRLGFGTYRLVHSTHLNELHNDSWYEQEAVIR